MNGKANLLQGPQQPFQAVGEKDGGGGVSQEQGTGDEQEDTQHHEDGLPNALLGDFENAKLPQHRTGGIKQVQDGGEGHDEQYRLQTLEESLALDAGDGDQEQHQHHQQPIGDHKFTQEDGDDKKQGEQQFRPGVQPVEDGVSWEVLPQGDIFQCHLYALLVPISL